MSLFLTLEDRPKDDPFSSLILEYWHQKEYKEA